MKSEDVWCLAQKHSQTNLGERGGCDASMANIGSISLSQTFNNQTRRVEF